LGRVPGVRRDECKGFHGKLGGGVRTLNDVIGIRQGVTTLFTPSAADKHAMKLKSKLHYVDLLYNLYYNKTCLMHTKFYDASDL